MYTIRQAAALTGVSADTLRAWERRYGVPTTVRSEGGYRLYDDHALDVVRRMRTLIEGGQAAAQAADAVLTSDAGEAAWTPDQFVEAVIAAPIPEEELSRRLLLALEAGPLAHTVDTWLMPMLRLVGQAWVDGRLTPAQEHVVSAAVIRRLSIAYERLPARPDAPPVLVGLPAGSRHEIGALTFALLLRQAGYSTVYLGQDLPTDSWVAAVEAWAPAAVVVAVLGTDTGPATETLQALRDAAPGLPVFVGGAFPGEAPEGVHVLPPSFSQSAAAFARVVPGAEEPRRAVPA